MKENSKMINTSDLLDILNKYCTFKEGKDVIVYVSLNVIHHDIFRGTEVTFYYNSVINGENVKKYLSEDDIYNALYAYVYNLGYELDNYKYISNVKQIGYISDDDVPIMNGVMLYFRDIKIKKKI